MGSPMSVVIADLTMQLFENSPLQKSPCLVVFWKRYAYDLLFTLYTLRICLHNENMLNILDITIMKDSVDSLNISVYRIS